MAQRRTRKGGGLFKFFGRTQRKPPEQYNVKGKLDSLISDVETLEDMNNRDIVPSIETLKSQVSDIVPSIEGLKSQVNRLTHLVQNLQKGAPRPILKDQPYFAPVHL